MKNLLTRFRLVVPLITAYAFAVALPPVVEAQWLDDEEWYDPADWLDGDEHDYSYSRVYDLDDNNLDDPLYTSDFYDDNRYGLYRTDYYDFDTYEYPYYQYRDRRYDARDYAYSDYFYETARGEPYDYLGGYSYDDYYTPDWDDDDNDFNAWY